MRANDREYYFRFRFRLGWLKSSWAIFAGIAGGTVTGLYAKGAAASLAPFGSLYLSFLKMCVIPVMICAIVPSLARLLMAKDAVRYLKKTGLVFAAALLAVSAAGLAAGWAGGPGKGLNPAVRATLGHVLLQTETSDTVQAASGGTGIVDFVTAMIPSNIFSSLVEGNSLQILFFCFIVGITLGFVPYSGTRQLLEILDVLFKVFQKAIGWSMYALPAGLFCMMSGQMAETGLGLLLAMGKFIIVMFGSSLLLMALATFFIRALSGISYIDTLKRLRRTLIIALGTRNSIATMPSVLETLCEEFRLPASTVHLVVPLGIILCRYSMVLVYSLTAVFVSQLYFTPLSFQSLVIVWIVSALAAVAGAGAPGVVSLSMLALVLDPIGLPSGAAVILLIAVNPIIDPVITCANIHLQCAAGIAIARESNLHSLQPAAE